MDGSAKKEQFNLAYVSALAAQAGFNPARLSVDDDSVDLELSGKDFSGALFRNPKIELQLKCSSQRLISSGVIKFPLPVKNYNQLRGEDVIVPRYLFVLLVPEPCDRWIRHHKKHLSLHNCCYWASVRKSPPTANTTSVTVEIPLSQRLTTEELVRLMTLASNGIGL